MLKSILLLTLVGSALTMRAEPGKDLTIGFCASLPTSFSPIEPGGHAKNYAQYLLHDSLIVFDEKWQPACHRCASLPSAQNGQMKWQELAHKIRKLRLTFELNPNWFWGDGKPVTVDDIIFTWKVLRSGGDVDRRNILREVVKIEQDPKIPRRFYLTLDRVAPFFEDMTRFFLLPKHLEEKIWNEAYGNLALYLENSNYRINPTLPGLYNGAFVISSVSPALQLTPNRFDKLPHGNITLLTFVDLVATKQPVDFEPEQLPRPANCRRMQDTTASRVKTFIGDSLDLDVIQFNLRNAILRDVKVRQAMAMGVDKEAIIAALPNRDLLPVSGFVHPADPFFDGQVKYFDLDRGQSALLLEASQWFTGKGFPREKNEKKFVVELYTSERFERVKTVELFKTQMAAIGIEVVPRIVSESDFLADLVRLNYPGLAFYTVRIPLAASLRSLFSKQAIPNVRNGYTGQNLSAWIVEKVDKAIDSLDELIDMEQRRQAVQQIQREFSAELPFIPLGYHVNKAFAIKDMQNFAIPGNQQPSSIWARRWVLR